jgi:hypothetical protein
VCVRSACGLKGDGEGGEGCGWTWLWGVGGGVRGAGLGGETKVLVRQD